MGRNIFAAVVAGMFAVLVLAGCGQKEMERLKAENVKIKEENANLQKELVSSLAENAEMKAKIDRILEILSPPPSPETPPSQEPAASGSAATGKEKTIVKKEPAATEEAQTEAPPAGEEKAAGEEPGYQPHPPQEPK